MNSCKDRQLNTLDTKLDYVICVKLAKKKSN